MVVATDTTHLGHRSIILYESKAARKRRTFRPRRVLKTHGLENPGLQKGKFRNRRRVEVPPLTSREGSANAKTAIQSK
jgi:hypothetical protein